MTRRQAILTVALLLVCVGAGSLAALFWPTRPPADSGDYVRWRGESGPLDVSFEIPDGWRVALDSGRLDKFEQVLVKGPRNADGTYSAMLVVRATASAAKGGRFQDAGELAAHYRRTLYPGHSVVAEETRDVAGRKALDLTVAYVAPPPSVKPVRGEAVKRLPVPVQTRTIFFERGGWIYELVLSSDRREFSDHIRRFDRLAAGFRFGDS